MRLPRFFADMPRPARGRWFSCVVIRDRSGLRTIAFAQEVSGLWRAYLVARLAAFWFDLRTKGSDTGINWAIMQRQKESPRR